jgi:hypothetical protein
MMMPRIPLAGPVLEQWGHRIGSSAAKVKSCHVLTSSLTKPEPAIRVRLIPGNYFIKRRILWQRLK